MKISIILAHPNPDSFNHAIAGAAEETLRRNGHQVILHDLCREQFPPLLSAAELRKDAALEPVIARHCEEVAVADGIIIVHPNWWGMPPAILKGWIDRVLRMEVAYRFVEGDNGEGVPVGLLKAKAAIVFNTANTLDERGRKVFGDPLETLWRIACSTCAACGRCLAAHSQWLSPAPRNSAPRGWLRCARRWNNTSPGVDDTTLTHFRELNFS
jgi:putative NADPH-quinone reductase